MLALTNQIINMRGDTNYTVKYEIHVRDNLIFRIRRRISWGHLFIYLSVCRTISLFEDDLLKEKVT